VTQRWGVICKSCHQPAFVVIGDLPAQTDVVMASRCQHLDGRPLEAEPLACDSCGVDFTLTGVEPSTEWRLMPEAFQKPHDPANTPFGSAADPTDIARVRLAISQATAHPKRPSRRKREPT
jgi:hypothetical protein